ncbi:MAG: PIN domain-containing protein [Patescibacteria group bacterium]
MIFVDTNYFLRFLLADVSDQHQKARILFREAAEGKVNLFTSAIVIFETCWVLLSNYDKDKDQVAKVLNSLLDMNFIDFEHHNLLRQAVSIYKNSPLGFIDAFNLLYAKAKGAKELKTFDIKLSKKFISL